MANSITDYVNEGRSDIQRRREKAEQAGARVFPELPSFIPREIADYIPTTRNRINEVLAKLAELNGALHVVPEQRNFQVADASEAASLQPDFTPATKPAAQENIFKIRETALSVS